MKTLFWCFIITSQSVNHYCAKWYVSRFELYTIVRRFVPGRIKPLKWSLRTPVLVEQAGAGRRGSADLHHIYVA